MGTYELASNGRAAEMVWYASYGSNLHRDRFLHYLRGGTHTGTGIGHRGARDPQPPRADRPVRVPFPLYFAGRSRRWAGGVAFLDHARTTPAPTLSRAYLMTVAQLEDVLSQESGRETEPLDVDAVVEAGALTVGEGYYDLVLHCGSHRGIPVMTFTSPRPMPVEDLAAPSIDYLRHISHGLRDSHRIGLDEIVRYLLTLEGVTPAWDAESLADALSPG